MVDQWEPIAIDHGDILGVDVCAVFKTVCSLCLY